MQPFTGESKYPFCTNEPVWCFNKVQNTMLKDTFHMRITCVDDKPQKIYYETIDFWPIRIGAVYKGISHYRVTTSNWKYILDKKKTLNLKLEVIFFPLLKKKDISFLLVTLFSHFYMTSFINDFSIIFFS